MSVKIAMAAQLPELQECTACHCYANTGFMLRDSSISRFVCQDCYPRFSAQYPMASRVVKLSRCALTGIVPEGRKPGFHAGYLMGRKESSDQGYTVTVSSFLDSGSLQSGQGTARFFCKEDALQIRKVSREQGAAVVGIYRTSPSGSPDFNPLDEGLLEDLLLDIVYMVIGGCSEIQIAVRDKSGTDQEIGVVFT